MCLFHFSHSLHTVNVRPPENACLFHFSHFTHCERSTPRKCVCLFHFSDSLHTPNVRHLENACVCFISQTVYTLRTFDTSKMHVSFSFLRQFTHSERSTPRKWVCLFHFSDSLHTLNVRPLENAWVCFISQTVYTLWTFDPSKMHVSISFFRQFTHCERSTPQKCMCLFHFSDSLHTANVQPLKMHVCVSHAVPVLHETRRITENSKTYRSCQGSFQMIDV